MTAILLSRVLVASAFSAVFAASAAHAGCGSRPGTPNEVRAEPLASAPNTTIRFSWRNTTGKGLNKSGSTSQGDTPHNMWFDISVRGGTANQFGNMTGIGPFKVTYGSRSHQDFPRLATPQSLCFKIRARTAGGTKGCVSAKFSNEVCATTAPRRKEIPGNASAATTPKISVTRQDGNVFLVMGNGFLPNKPVAIRMVDATTLRGPIVTTLAGRPIFSKANGTVAVLLAGMCNQTAGPLAFSANDGRTSRTDKTGTLWSNTVTVACQR